jgi:hypothetical protein
MFQVSFFSTSPELSNKQRFEFFTRTIPSDHYQVKAMVDIVGRMGWKYISILYEESNYGIKVRQTLPFRLLSFAMVHFAVHSGSCGDFPLIKHSLAVVFKTDFRIREAWLDRLFVHKA